MKYQGEDLPKLRDWPKAEKYCPLLLQQYQTASQAWPALPPLILTIQLLVFRQGSTTTEQGRAGPRTDKLTPRGCIGRLRLERDRVEESRDEDRDRRGGEYERLHHRRRRRRQMNEDEKSKRLNIASRPRRKELKPEVMVEQLEGGEKKTENATSLSFHTPVSAPEA